MLAAVARAARSSSSRTFLVRGRWLSSRVSICQTEADFENAKQSEAGSVVYFTASAPRLHTAMNADPPDRRKCASPGVICAIGWCGPCRMISPAFDALADDAAADTTFLKVDVDDQPEIAAMAEVSAMPTFQFYRAGAIVETIVGADVQKLKHGAEMHLGAK